MRVVLDTNVVASGDDDLHALGSYQGITVITAAEALALITRSP